MATTPSKTDAEKAARDAVKEAAEEIKSDPKVDEDELPTYSHEDAVANAFDLVGHEPHIVAGALNGVSKKSLTAAEIDAAVNKWLKAEVV